MKLPRVLEFLELLNRLERLASRWCCGVLFPYHGLTPVLPILTDTKEALRANTHSRWMNDPPPTANPVWCWGHPYSNTPNKTQQTPVRTNKQTNNGQHLPQQANTHTQILQQRNKTTKAALGVFFLRKSWPWKNGTVNRHSSPLGHLGCFSWHGNRSAIWYQMVAGFFRKAQHGSFRNVRHHLKTLVITSKGPKNCDELHLSPLPQNIHKSNRELRSSWTELSCN